MCPSFRDRTEHFVVFFFFFNDTATTEIYTLSLHDALPISSCCARAQPSNLRPTAAPRTATAARNNSNLTPATARKFAPPYPPTHRHAPGAQPHSTSQIGRA